MTALALGWTLAYSAIGYAIALRTGSPAAIQGAAMLFFPFVFFTTSFVPRAGLTGWMATVADLNPVTYVLDAMLFRDIERDDHALVARSRVRLQAVDAPS